MAHLLRSVRGAAGRLKGRVVRRLTAPRPLPLALIVGAQRSGTTWLQMLCAAHPKIAGGAESHLFSQYLGQLAHTYYSHVKRFEETGAAMGLPCYLTEDEFHLACRDFGLRALRKMKSAKRGARLVIEKTPDHSLHLGFIRQLLPQTRLLHVIRDGRDVAVSNRMAAKENWGRGWAVEDAADAARKWADWVSRGRAMAHPAELYLEVRYEDLLQRGPAELSRVYEFLRLPLPAAEVDAIYKRFEFAEVSGARAPRVLVQCGKVSGRPPPPKNFFRQGKVGTWREHLSPQDLEAIDTIAGPLLRQLGYA